MLSTLTAFSLVIALQGPNPQVEPLRGVEQLPAPRWVVTGAAPFRPEYWRRPPPPEVHGAFQRDRYGVLRPRIVAGPYGHAFYAGNGEPYWFMPVRTAP
jgi:hypothetical protein